jgi:alcohol dehydrogenase
VGVGTNQLVSMISEIPETFTMATVIVRPGGNVANVGVHGRSVDLALNELWIKEHRHINGPGEHEHPRDAVKARC